jgi:hypothetical protein
MDFTASSAVSLPIIRASLRLVVLWMGVLNPLHVFKSPGTATVYFHKQISCSS